jgi:membrane protease YdiL (CAAX protease family)
MGTGKHRKKRSKPLFYRRRPPLAAPVRIDRLFLKSCSSSHFDGRRAGAPVQSRHFNNKTEKNMSLREFAKKRPTLTAMLCAGLMFATTTLILAAGKTYAPAAAYGKVKLLAFASTVLLPMLMVQVFGMWREVRLGFSNLKPSPFFLACLVPTLMFASMGVHQHQGSSLNEDLVIQFFNAFGEELLFRGVIFVILLSLPQWKAILINGLLFGSMHMIHGYMDGNWMHAFWWSFMATGAGLMMTAARYRVNNLWLMVGLHMIMNLSSMYSNVEHLAGADVNEMVEHGVKVVEYALGLYAMVASVMSMRRQRLAALA